MVRRDQVVLSRSGADCVRRRRRIDEQVAS
jgi:hypothetical protein